MRYEADHALVEFTLVARDDVQSRLNGGKVYTDRVITGLARMAGSTERMWRMPPSYPHNPVNAAKFYSFDKPNEEGLEFYSHLIFEKRSLPSEMPLEERIAICAQAMQHYIKTHRNK